MIYGVRVAVSKSIPDQHKSFAWELIEVYDVLLRKHGIDFVTWTVDDRGDHFVIIGMIPGDFGPELSLAKEEIKEAIADVATDTEGNVEDENEEDTFEEELE